LLYLTDEQGGGSTLTQPQTQISVIPATLADAEKLALLNKQLIEDENHDNPMTVDQLTERMSSFLSGDYSAIFCVDENQKTLGKNKKILGYALVNKTTNPIYLRQFFIFRDERRKGYGKQFLIKLLESLNTDTIDIEVLAGNEAGKAFWLSLNFKPISIYIRYEREV